MIKMISKALLIATAFTAVSCGTAPSQSELLSNSSNVQMSDLQDRKDAWNEAFQWGQSKSRKARLLSVAIRGVGESTASKLLDAGYLRFKPRSWTSFKNVMKDASEDRWAGVKDVYANAVQKYGSDNSKLFKSSPAPRPTGKWGCTFDKWAPRSQRASCLASSVRGIGKSTASTLINGNEFRYAPANWSDFKSYMRTLERRFDLNDLYLNTVERYGSDNKRNLYPRGW